MTTMQQAAAVKRIRRALSVMQVTDAGGQWPPNTPPTKPVEPWRGSGRYTALSCRGCGAACDPSRRWCAACGESLP